jgi:hypothetical protein
MTHLVLVWQNLTAFGNYKNNYATLPQDLTRAVNFTLFQFFSGLFTNQLQTPVGG